MYPWLCLGITLPDADTPCSLYACNACLMQDQVARISILCKQCARSMSQTKSHKYHESFIRLHIARPP